MCTVVCIDTIRAHVFRLNEILHQARAFLIFGVCFYTVWTVYRIHSNNELLLKKGIGNEASNCHKTPLSQSVTFFPNNVTERPNDQALLTTTKYPVLLPNNISDISTAYRRQLVGFPNLYGISCKLALNEVVNNSIFPSEVTRIYPDQFISASIDCRAFVETYGYNRYPAVSQEELEFPIAFIILFHMDLDQVLFLLRALYRPHNVYCLTVDTKVSVEFLEAVKSVTRCLPNVFVASQLENIVYAGFSRLMADIHCMADLLKHPVQWKYAINMPGQQFPLRTNLELVRILRRYNGANDVEGITGGRMIAGRFQVRWTYVKDKDTRLTHLEKTKETKEPPPHNLTIVKGSAYGTFSRAFVHFLLHNQVAKDFLDWCKEIYSPDEYFWATLHHSKSISVPGGYTGKPDLKPWITTYTSWAGYDPCTTMHTHGVCIFSPGDLPQLMARHELFANKFYITHHPAALHCLDEMLFNLTFTRSTRNLTYYGSLPFALPAS